MENMKRIIINKNRGWRGLAELRCYDAAHNNIHTMMFSFSELMWLDLMRGVIITQDEAYYYAIEFNNTESLPKGQRSVLIKSFNANVTDITKYPKGVPTTGAKTSHIVAIDHFKRNRNNHTQSDWNCIGIRVVPMI